MIYYDSINDEIVIDNEQREINFSDIRTSVLSQGYGIHIINIGNMYYIDCDVRIKNNSIVKDSNISVTVLGKYFQVEKGSSFQLGDLGDNDTTSGGCYFSMPNVEVAYGFGENTIINESTNSGNLYLYNSRIDVYGFWGFFSGPNQEVHIIDCVVNGFGRVEGETSRVENVIFEKSHPRYGIIGPKGELLQYENLVSNKGEDCSFYFNPDLIGDTLIVKNAELNNYNRLVYCEPSDTEKVCRFVDAKLSGNTQIRKDINTVIEIAYTFNPIFIDNDNIPFSNSLIEIYDEYNEMVFSGLTDTNGKINTQLVLRRIYWDTNEDYTSTLFNVRIIKENEYVDYLYEHDSQPWYNKPFFIRDPLKDIGLIDSSNDNIIDSDLTVIPDSDNTGNIIDYDISDSANIAIYICEHFEEDMIKQKEYVISKISETDLLENINIYTDRARHAYDLRPSYESLIMNVLNGNIKRIYTYNPETFGPTRKNLTNKIFNLVGTEVIYTAPTL